METTFTCVYCKKEITSENDIYAYHEALIPNLVVCFDCGESQSFLEEDSHCPNSNFDLGAY